MKVTLHDIPETLWQRWCMLCHQENRTPSEVTEKLLSFALDHYEKTGRFVPVKEKHETNVFQLPDHLKRMRNG